MESQVRGGKTCSLWKASLASHPDGNTYVLGQLFSHANRTWLGPLRKQTGVAISAGFSFCWLEVDPKMTPKLVLPSCDVQSPSSEAQTEEQAVDYRPGLCACQRHLTGY